MSDEVTVNTVLGERTSLSASLSTLDHNSRAGPTDGLDKPTILTSIQEKIHLLFVSLF